MRFMKQLGAVALLLAVAAAPAAAQTARANLKDAWATVLAVRQKDTEVEVVRKNHAMIESRRPRVPPGGESQ